MPQPSAEVHLTVADVERLVAAQHPGLTSTVLPVGAGWDNVVFRLGEQLAVRLPQRSVAVPLLENEQRWLPVIAPRLPVPVPAPVAVGLPDATYPWPWSIVPWFEGTPAAHLHPEARDAVAGEVATFVRAMHQPAPADAPHNPFRGVPLSARAETMPPRLAPFPELTALWLEGCAAPVWPDPPVWLHGDLHPGNMIVSDGALRAVIDFGDLCAGDPASDLSIAWTGFTPTGRAVFRAALEGRYDPHVWTRARAWAAAIAALVADADDAWLRDISAHTIAQLAAE